MATSTRVSVLQKSSLSLINGTESAAEQRDYSDELKSDVIGSMRLSESVSVEDSQDYAREVIVNSAKKVGVRVNSQDVNEILNSNIQDLDIKFEKIGQMSADAFAIGGMQATSSGSITSDSIGLLTTTSDMLEDGKLTGKEVVQISASAAKTAGSVIAMYSGTLATGPLGAIIAIPFAAVNFLQAEIDEQAALDKAAHEYARAVIAEERRKITAVLSEARSEYVLRRGSVWKEADRVVSDLAELWYKCESDIGVYFDIRFFPGEAPPPKGGLWRYPDVDGRPCVRAATPVGGQVYFPRPAKEYKGALFTSQVESVRKAFQDAEYDKELARKGLYRAPCSTDPYKAHPLYEPQNKFSGYSFYQKTIRALNALLPQDDKQGFWVPETYSTRTSTVEWKDYEQLVYKLYYEMSIESNQTPPSSIREALQKYENHVAESAKNPKYPKPPSISNYALAYITSLFEALIEEGEHVNVFKLRVFGDIMQTASAVRAEIEAAKYFREAGLLDSGVTVMTQADKRNTVLEAPKGWDLGKAVFWAGLATAGVGGYSYWRRKHAR